MTDDRQDLADLVRRQIDAQPPADTGSRDLDAALDRYDAALDQFERHVEGVEALTAHPPTLAAQVARQFESDPAAVEPLIPVTGEQWPRPGAARRL